MQRPSYLGMVSSHPEWLGQPFLDEAEYLGEVAGTGGSVFVNVTGIRITDAHYRGYSRTRNGIDWG